MGLPVLIIGKSGSGKSTSLRHCCNDNWNIIKVLNKPLPFRGHIKGIQTDRYDVIKRGLIKSTARSLVIDDAGYLLTNNFMRGHNQIKKGDDSFRFYNQLADEFWNLILFINELSPEKIVYIIMHEDVDAGGTIKSKTIGKLLDDKVCIEGMFTIVFRCVVEGENHLFVTQSANGAISKTPVGMFEDLTIDNDLAMVDKRIREYYEEEPETEEKSEAAETEEVIA